MGNNYTRDENAMSNIPQDFADRNFKKCPFCKAEEPKWMVREEWKLLGKNYYFKCPSCESILRASQDDVTGLSFTTKSFAGQMKKYKGKESRTVYITVEKIDYKVRTVENMVLEGAEIPLEELVKIAEKEEI